MSKQKSISKFVLLNSISGVILMPEEGLKWIYFSHLSISGEYTLILHSFFYIIFWVWYTFFVYLPYSRTLQSLWFYLRRINQKPYQLVHSTSFILLEIFILWKLQTTGLSNNLTQIKVGLVLRLKFACFVFVEGWQALN